MGAAGFGLIAALGFAAGSLVTKRLVGRFDFDQLIGPAFVLNAMWLIPLAPFVEWEWSGTIVLLQFPNGWERFQLLSLSTRTGGRRGESMLHFRDIPRPDRRVQKAP